jgi:hypothetical protein
MSKNIGRKASAQDNFTGPNPVTGVTATDVGTGRAFNNGAVTVSWTAPVGGNEPTGYKVYEGTNVVATVAFGTNTATIQGLASGSSRTFQVSSYDTYLDNNSNAVAASAVTVTTVPDAPVSPVATPGVNQNTISWTAPSNGGKAITNYYVVGNDGTSGNTASTSVPIADTANTSQYYNVYADNANGRSVA